MAKRKRPFIVRLLKWLFGIILVLALIVGAIVLFLKLAYGINIIDTIGQINTLNQTVEVNNKYDNMFSAQDMESAKNIVNLSIDNLITYSQEDGYNISSSVSSLINAQIKLTDKQIAAIADVVIQKQGSANLQMGGSNLTLQLLQVKFSNLIDNKVDINFVTKINTTELKKSMTTFPVSLISNYIPDDLYISSTITVTKGQNPFEYTVEHKSLQINNLTTQQTESFLETLNNLIKFGTAQNLNTQIGTVFVNVLIGNSQNNGFTYSLNSIGVTDFNFILENNTIYYVIQN